MRDESWQMINNRIMIQLLLGNQFHPKKIYLIFL
jgi:hypothetical protein